MKITVVGAAAIIATLFVVAYLLRTSIALQSERAQ